MNLELTFTKYSFEISATLIVPAKPIHSLTSSPNNFNINSTPCWPL